MKAVSLYGREVELGGSDADIYYNNFTNGSDITDSVLTGIRPYVAKDAICLDVGANIGIFSLALSILAPRGKVYAFEPSPMSYAYLHENLEANEIKNVEALCLAISDVSGEVHFNDVPEFSAGSHPVNREWLQGHEVWNSRLEEVPATSLDDFVSGRQLQKLDFMKLDVEGGELSVLAGAPDTLVRFQPLAVIEFNTLCLDLFQGIPSRTALERVKGLFPHVYVMHRLDGSPALLSTEDEIHKFLFENGLYGRVDNLLCSFEALPVTTRYADVTAIDLARLPMEAQIANDQRELALARAEIEAMRATVSWRATAPLRWFRRYSRKRHNEPHAQEGKPGR